MSKQTNPARTCADCLHCQACHLWSSGAISDSVAPKCPQFEPARYASLAELQDLYRMYKGELVPVVHGRWMRSAGKSHIWYCSACGDKINYKQNRRTYNIPKVPVEQKNKFCRNCGAKMDGGTQYVNAP